MGREMAFKAVFQLSFEKSTIDETIATLMVDEGVRSAAKEFGRELAVGTSDHLADIDAAIQAHSTNWDPERIVSTDRAILRVAVYELLHRDEIPHEVTINEAIELAKKYGDDDSSKFVNGILDNIRKAA